MRAVRPKMTQASSVHGLSMHQYLPTSASFILYHSQLPGLFATGRGSRGLSVAFPGIAAQLRRDRVVSCCRLFLYLFILHLTQTGKSTFYRSPDERISYEQRSTGHWLSPAAMREVSRAVAPGRVVSFFYIAWFAMVAAIRKPLKCITSYFLVQILLHRKIRDSNEKDAQRTF